MRMVRIILAVMVFFGWSLLWTPESWSGQGYIINEDGEPVLWDASAADPIAIHPESGECGQFTNAQMLDRIESNLDHWTDLTTADLGFAVTTGLVTGVDGCNYTDYLAGVVGNTTAQNTSNIQDGINPVLFDNDGEIMDAATGEANGRFTILGFANPAGFTVDASDSSLYTGIAEGQAVFNCYCLEDSAGNPANSDCTTAFTVDDLDFTMVHEMGHFFNLDHSQINDDASDAGTDNDDELPTMYPVSISAGDQKTPIEDDIMAVSSLYPSSTFFTSGNSSSNYCMVTGTLLDRFGEAMRCADVQAIDSADNTMSVAFVSGAYAPAVDNNGDNDSADSGECSSNCGDFKLYLRPGRSYTLKSASINQTFKGGSGISPCANTQIAACTDTLIGNCTDGDTGTTCRNCVQDETHTTNSNGDNIATKIASECVAGATVSLGNITGGSVSGASATSLNLMKGLMDVASHPSVAIDAAHLLPYGAAGFETVASCPESGGSTTTNNGSSSGSSSSVGCSLRQGAAPAGGLGLWLLGLMGVVGLCVRGVRASQGS